MYRITKIKLKTHSNYCVEMILFHRNDKLALTAQVNETEWTKAVQFLCAIVDFIEWHDDSMVSSATL